MPDNRKNLQVEQPGIEGYATADKNGWPTPLADPSNPLKFVVSNGSRGETKDFRAMETSRQGEHSLPEGQGGVKREGIDDLSVKVKVTKNDSLA